MSLKAGDQLLKFTKELISQILDVLNSSVKVTKERIANSLNLKNAESDSLDNLINGQLSS